MVKTVVCVLLTGLLVGLTLAFAPAVVASKDEPTCSMTLTLPESALELRLDHRQIGPDLSRYQETEGLDSIGLHQLQIMSHLAQGTTLKSGVTLRVGSHSFKPASYRMGFTVSRGESMRFFLVHGTEAVILPSTELKPGWVTERLVMHLEYVSRIEARIIWHLGEKAGSIALGLGTAGPTPGPPTPVAPPAGDEPAPPQDGAPRDG